MSFDFPPSEVFSRGDLLGVTTGTNSRPNFESQIEAFFADALADDAAARAAGDLGPALPPLSPNFISWRGAWQPNVAYSPYDAVYRNNSSYIAVGNNENLDPGTLPTTVWGAAIPGGTATGDVMLGMSFGVTADTYLTEMHFFRTDYETPTSHTLSLWSTAGVLLTSATTSGETGVGWVAAGLATPYLLSSTETYIVSVYVSDEYGNEDSVLPRTSGVIEAIASYRSGAEDASPYPSNPGLFNYGLDISVSPAGVWNYLARAAGGSGGAIDSVQDDPAAYGETLISSESTANDIYLKTLVAGDNITVIPSGTADIIIAAAAYTLTNDSTATGVSLISTETTTFDFKLRTLIAGSGISLDELTTGDVRIANNLPGWFDSGTILYLDQAAPPGGNGSPAFPWQSLDEMNTAFGAMTGTFQLIIRPGTYTITGDVIVWPSGGALTVVAEGAGQSLTSLNCTVQIIGDVSGLFSFWTSMNVLTFDYDLTPVTGGGCVLVHNQMNYNSNGDPGGLGLKLSACTAPFQIIMVLNSGLLQMSTECTMNAMACSIGNWAIKAGGFAKAVSSLFLFGDINIESGGIFQTLVVSKMPTAGAINGVDTGADPEWYTDTVSQALLGVPTGTVAITVIGGGGGSASLATLTDCSFLPTGDRHMHLGHTNVATTTEVRNVVVASDSTSWGVMIDATANCVVQDSALLSCTNASGNTIIGAEACFAAENITDNSVHGHQALYSNVIGNFNTAVGAYTGYYSTGDGNSFFGESAGTGLINGAYNTFLGRNTSTSLSGGSYMTVIGEGAVGLEDFGAYLPATTLATISGLPTLFNTVTGQLGPMNSVGVANQVLTTDGLGGCSWQPGGGGGGGMYLFTPDYLTPGPESIGNSGYSTVIIDIENLPTNWFKTFTVDDGSTDGETLLVATRGAGLHFSTCQVTFSGGLGNNIDFAYNENTSRIDLMEIRGFTLVWSATFSKWTIGSPAFAPNPAFVPYTIINTAPISMTTVGFKGVILDTSSGNVPTSFSLGAQVIDGATYTIYGVGSFPGSFLIPLVAGNVRGMTTIEVSTTSMPLVAMWSASLSQWLPLSGPWI